MSAAKQPPPPPPPPLVTVTVALAEPEPPAPVQVMEYVLLSAGNTVAVPLVPDGEKFVPVQDVALVELQVSVELSPLNITVGDAESDAVAAGTTVMLSVFVTEPPVPVHVML